MTPWWLRPPAEEGKSDEPSDRPSERGPEEPPERAGPSAASKKSRTDGGRKTGRRRRTGGARRSGGGRANAGQGPDLGGSPGVAAQPGSAEAERRIALFCDLESIALGARESDRKGFDLTQILERLLEKGKVVVKKAYADWERFSDLKRGFHDAGVELIDIPRKHHSGKSAIEVKMAVDAIELCYAKRHLDTFVFLSGDGDLSPLVAKLKENDKLVIGIGEKGSASKVLIDNCDEYLFYEDLRPELPAIPELQAVEGDQAEAFALMIAAIQALERENKEVLWSSMVKQTMKRKRPSFSEGHYGYSAFSELLEDAERHGIVELERDQRSGSYIVKGLARARV